MARVQESTLKLENEILYYRKQWLSTEQQAMKNRYMYLCEDQGRQTKNSLASQNLATKHSFIHYSHWLLRTKRVTHSYRRYWYPWRTPHPAITSDTNIPLSTTYLSRLSNQIISSQYQGLLKHLVLTRRTLHAAETL